VSFRSLLFGCIGVVKGIMFVSACVCMIFRLKQQAAWLAREIQRQEALLAELEIESPTAPKE